MAQPEFNFEWDPQKAAANVRKHGISFDRAASTFQDPEALTLVDREHSEDGERWITPGLDSHGSLLVVCHTWRELRVPVLAVASSPRAKQPKAKSGNTGANDMKKEYDFSKAERGKFYRRGARLKLPVYLDPEVQARLTKAAQKRREDVSALVNRLLKREIETAEALS
jgi:uncharacterized DUF497 family protein